MVAVTRPRLPRGMTMPSIALALALALTGGCDRAPAHKSGEVDTAPLPIPTIVPALPPSPAAATATPSAAPRPTTPVTSRDPAAVLAGWAQAIEARDWKLARAYWGNFGGDSGFSDSEFAARWNVLIAPRVTLGPGANEGAAGSLYYDAPVMVADGKRRFGGNVVLRRALLHNYRGC